MSFWAREDPASKTGGRGNKQANKQLPPLNNAGQIGNSGKQEMALRR